MALWRFWKPWFVYRPSQLLRRFRPPPFDQSSQYPEVPTAWGLRIRAHPSRAIGHSLLTTGVFDLAVSEVLVRLIVGPHAGRTPSPVVADRSPAAGDVTRPGPMVVDAGANVGYMTVLMAAAAGPAGRVLSFEPHPDLFAVLQRNIADASGQAALARIEAHNVALGDRDGVADLVVPPDFSSNDGTAHVAADGSDVALRTGTSMQVPIRRLDDVLGSSRADVLKLDVEGFEARVLAGARRALDEHRIRHIVFEDHDVERSDVVRLLRDCGYRVFALGWTLRRLQLSPIETVSPARYYEAPSFVATLEPDEVIARCRRAGWRTLRPL